MLARHPLPAWSPETQPVHADLPRTLPSLSLQQVTTIKFCNSLVLKTIQNGPRVYASTLPVDPVHSTFPPGLTLNGYEGPFWNHSPRRSVNFYLQPASQGRRYESEKMPARKKPRKPVVRNQSSGLKTRHGNSGTASPVSRG